MGWLWVVGGLVVWVVVAGALGLLIGRCLRLADLRERGAVDLLTTADLPAALVAPVPAVRRARRRAVPLPPVGIALAALAVVLMTTGYGLRLAGATGPIAQVFSMDAPYSLPRLYVAALFGAAALAAVVGAGSTRRTWWLAVGVVAGGISLVKAGSTMHIGAMAGLTGALGGGGALLVSGLVAAAAVGALWYVSRADRRDRRRVLGALTGYAFAAVGLSAMSSIAPASLAVTLTYIEESGEALAGVALVMAVFVGVAPQLVLPADWALRRAADAHSVEVTRPAQRPVVGGTP